MQGCVIVGVRTNMNKLYRKTFITSLQKGYAVTNCSSPTVNTQYVNNSNHFFTHIYKRRFSGDSSSGSSSSKGTNKLAQPSVHPYRKQIIYVSLTFLSIMSMTVSYLIISDKKKVHEAAEVTNVGKPNVGGPWSLVDHHGTAVSTVCLCICM